MIDMAGILLAFFIVTVSPGPANLAVATVSMSEGRKSGLMFGFGLAIGLAFWGLVAATGMGAVLQTSEIVLFLLKIFGGIYLLWLAVSSGRSAIQPQMTANNPAKGKNRFVQGLLLNILNPKAVVAWMAALSMGMGVGNSTVDLFLATFLCMVIGALNYSLHALAFSISSFMNVYQRLRKWIEGFVAALFAIAGFSLIRSAFSR